jgi:ribonuclease E
MGISPLLKLDREGKSSRSVIINVVESGDLPSQCTELNELNEPPQVSETIIGEAEIADGFGHSVIPAPKNVATQQSLEPEIESSLTIVSELTIVPAVSDAEADSSGSSSSVPNRRRRRRSSAIDT